MNTPVPELLTTLGKAAAATRNRSSLIDTDDVIRPPRLIPRRLFADAVSQLFHAERATARMCRQMAGRTGSDIADRLLRFQAADERHHADLYESYLSRIGDILPQDSRIAEALEMLLDTSLGQ